MLENASTGYQGRVLRSRGAPGADATGQHPARPEPDALDEARRQAAAIVAAARAEAEEIAASARATMAAELARRLAALERDYRNDMADAGLGLVEVVRRAVEEILDERPGRELAERAVRRALRDWPNRDLTLRCAPRALDAGIDLARRLEAEGYGAIRAVTPDPDLPEGAWRLESGGVAVELGRAAQLDELDRILRAALDGARDGAGDQP